MLAARRPDRAMTAGNAVPTTTPPLRRLGPVDGTPVMAWLTGWQRALAHLPILGALALPIGAFALVWTLAEPGFFTLVGAVVLAGITFRVGRLGLLTLRRKQIVRVVRRAARAEAQDLDNFRS